MRIFRGRLTMTTLNVAFQEAKENNNLYIGLLPEKSGAPEPFLLIVENANFEYTLDEMKQIYDDHLSSKFAPETHRIKGIMIADALASFKTLIRVRD